MSGVPQVIVRDRQQGKTTELVRWLLGGHRIDGWPGWSRVLVVADGSAVRAIHNDATFAAENRQLRDSGCLGGLGKVVVTAHEFRLLYHGLHPEVDWALDGAEQIIAHFFCGLPDVMSITGEAR